MKRECKNCTRVQGRLPPHPAWSKREGPATAGASAAVECRSMKQLSAPQARDVGATAPSRWGARQRSSAAHVTARRSTWGARRRSSEVPWILGNPPQESSTLRPPGLLGAVPKNPAGRADKKH